MTEEHGHRQKHLTLSFLGGMLTFQCSVPGDGENQKGSVLTFSRLSFQREEGSFSKTHAGVAVINRKSSDVDIVKCSSVLDVRRRVTVPCILLTQRMERGSFNYSLLTLNSCNSIETHLEFKLPYRMRDNVAILQGPTVLWSYDGFAFYTSLQGGEVRQIPTKLTLNLVGESPLNTGKIFILCSQTPSKESTNSQSNAAGSSKNCGYFVEDGQVGLFDGDLMLPHAYSSITQCIFVVTAVEVNGVLKSTVVAATNKNQLVYFENGMPREVCKLPFEEPVDNIQMANTGRNGCLSVLSFHQGHVCAIWMDTFQVASCWSGVSFLHVDDFLGCGTDQILLLFEVQSPTGCPLENFLITDLCGTTYSRGQESSDAGESSDVAQENLVLTVKALESRLQSGWTLLQDLQSGGRQKERLVRQSVGALTDMVSGRRHVLTPPEQEGLACLWDEDEEAEDEVVDEKMQVSPPPPSSPSPPPLVEKLWHRVVEDRLVVGVTLTPESVVPPGSVVLSIVAEAGLSPAPVVQTRGRVSWLPTPGRVPTHPEPAAKRPRGGGGAGEAARLAVTSVTPLTPLLTSGQVTCPVMLHYVPGQGSSAALAVVQCGRVPVGVRAERPLQLLDDCKLTTDEAREDLLSLQAALDSWVLRIDSPDRSLADVSAWLQTSMRCEALAVSPNHLLCSPAGPSSALTLFHWRQDTPFRGELSVYCSEFRLLRFLESLRGFLPASCSVLPLPHGGGAGSALPLSSSLERELLSLRDGLSALLCGEEEEEEEEEEESGRAGHPEEADPGCAEAVRRSRDRWLRDRDRSCRRLSPLVDSGRYSDLTQSLTRSQLDGDVAALLEIQRTLIGRVLP